MRVVVHGQQAFGKAVLERLLEKGENVVAVFCAPDKEGRPRDPLAEFAEAKGLPVHQPTSWKTPEAEALMRSFEPDVCMMAYVTLFVPEAVRDIPKYGTFQYHPSLLPLHRGPSSINWPIIMGEKTTGLTIFWPDDGLDEGPVLLQKEVDIGPDDTLGSLYFERLFPMGVDAMLEALDMVRDGKAPSVKQDDSKATYESWCKKADARIDWSQPASKLHDLIRGCDPQPGAWTTLNGEEIKVFDSQALPGGGKPPGTVVDVNDSGVVVATGDGDILLGRARPKDAKKGPASDWARGAGLTAGATLGG